MKKEKLIPFLLLICLFAAPGCKKWLDVKPATQVDPEQLFNSENGFQDAMYGVYTIMASTPLYGDQLTMSFIDVLAQRYNCQSTPGHIFYQASLYNYQDATVKTRISQAWDTMYHAIANVNNVLLHIDGRKDIFQPNNYALIKGEALGLRAFLHLDLLRLFGTSVSSNPTKPAIPYVTTVSGGVTPLSTVTQVLDSVIKELTTASELLSVYKDINSDVLDASNQQPNSWLNRRQNHFNYYAAEATLARAYLYKGDKQHALQHALNVINSNLFSFQTTPRINDFKDRTFIPEQVFALSKFNLQPQVSRYFQATDVRNLGREAQLTNDYAPGGVIEQLYEAGSGGVSDIRYALMWAVSGGISFPTKYWQDAGASRFRNLVPLIRLPEMYYIAAECSDTETGADYINTVRQNRGLAALPSGMDAATLQAEISKEYQKEFYAEGQLFYYYKRTNSPQIRFTITPGSDRVYVLPLPDAELQQRQ